MEPHAATELFRSVAAVAAISRLIRLNLARRFTALSVWLVFTAAADAAASVLPQKSWGYFYFYVAAVPLEIVFSVWAVFELISLVFTNYPGIRTMGRWILTGGLLFSMLVSTLLTEYFWNLGAAGRLHSVVSWFQVAHRSVVFSLAVLILALLYSLSHYPLRLSRNTYVSSGFFACVFLSQALVLLLDSMNRRLNSPVADWTQTIFSALCLWFWAAMLTAETVPEPALIRFESAHEHELLDQLDSLNQLLRRAARQ